MLGRVVGTVHGFGEDWEDGAEVPAVQEREGAHVSSGNVAAVAPVSGVAEEWL